MNTRLLALLALLVPPAAVAAGSLARFPKKTGAPIEGSAVAADLTGSGEQVVVVAAGGQVHAFAPDGRGLPGYPVALGKDEEAAGDLAAADLDGDARADIAVATRSGKLFVLSRGAIAPGFPVELGAGCAAGPSFGDLDGDGRPEVLQGDRSGKLHAFKLRGQPLPPFPVQLGEDALTSSPSAGRLRGELAIAVGSEKGAVHVIDAKGASLQGFPLVTHFTVSGAPAFGDLDDDGEIDLVATSRDFNVYAVSGSGGPLPGFPLRTGMACHGSPALADLDGDDVLDLAFTCNEGQLWAVSGAGKSLPGFPVKLSSSLLGGVAVADADRDGRVELLVAEREGLLHAFSSAGKRIGPPAKLGGQSPVTPFAGRLKDGGVVVYTGTVNGNLAAVRFDGKAAPRGKKTAGPPAAIPWAGSARDAARSGWFRPNPLRYKGLALSPTEARIDDKLVASWTYFSVDGTPEPPPPITWFRNNQRVKELDGKREVSPRTTRKGERWRFDLQVGARTVKGPELTIVNTAPTSPGIRIQPPALSVEASARVEVVTPSQDADGDKVTYRFAWLKDSQRTELAGDTVPAKLLEKGQRWTAVVTPFDGQHEGRPAIAEAIVVNTPPGPPVLAIQPASPRKGDTVTAALRKAAQDPDNDPLQYRYRWSAGDEPRNYPLAQSTLPTDSVKKGDRLSVQVVAFDGKAEGAPWTGSVQMVNTPPPPPGVAILPPSPGAGQALRAAVVAPSADADADLVTYRAAWTKNGTPYTPQGDPFEIAAAEVRKGDRWAVVVTPNDGEVDGKPGAADVTIRNTPPSSPWIALAPEHPTTGGGIELELLRPSEDVDGDAVKYTFSWSRNGAPVGNPSNPREKARRALGANEFRKHEKVRVAVTPSDGAADGPIAEAEVKVDNALPGAPVVALEPAAPTNQRPLAAVIRTPAPDTDGDTLKYRYAWVKNGALQPLPETQAALPASALHKGDRWTVKVRAFDGEGLGPAVSASAVVGNAPPPAPKVTIVPAAPRRGQELRALLTEAVDPDGDVLAYRFEWRRDGNPVALPPQAASVPSDLPRKGERWTVDVIASDGEADSPRARAEARIANTPPTSPAVELCQGPVPAGAPLEVTLPVPSTDADGDSISYEYTWTVNGRPAPKWAGRKKLGAGDTRKHDQLEVTVTPGDGAGKGTPGVAACEVEDTPPGPPRVAFEPVDPGAETGVKVVVTRAAEDRDGDKVSYRYAWTKNGLPFDPGGDGAAVKPGGLKRGDELRVVVTSFDGEREGGQAVLSVRTRNTPPSAPAVSLSPAQPVKGEELTCFAKPRPDSDGDPLQVRIRWSRDGQPTTLAQDQAELPPGIVRKGERWRCEAWTDDGFARSPSASAEVKVKNSAPPAPTIVIEPETASTDDELVCRIAAEARDLDGEPVKYRYLWTRDGQPVPPGNAPAIVPASATRKGETWKCTVVSSDGELEGPAVTAERRIVNSPPGPARVRIGPEPGVPGKPLLCELLEPAVDPDGDKLDHRFFWLRGGAQQSFAPISREVPGRLVRSKDVWSCEVQATDGELEGPRTSGGALALP